MNTRQFTTLATLLMMTCAALAEEPPKRAATKIEQFQGQSGAVIIMGASDVGEVAGEYGAKVEIQAREIINAKSGERRYGIYVRVNEGGRLEREHSSYIDYEEIQPLLAGIDYIMSVRKEATQLESFQADFTTVDDLRISTYSTSVVGEVKASIRSGTIGPARAFIGIDTLQRFRGLIENAKVKIDAARAATSPPSS